MAFSRGSWVEWLFMKSHDHQFEVTDDLLRVLAELVKAACEEKFRRF